MPGIRHATGAALLAALLVGCAGDTGDSAAPASRPGAAPASDTAPARTGPAPTGRVPSGSAPAGSTPTRSAAAGSTPTGTGPVSPTAARTSAPARRRLVVLDPGHDGGNAAAPAEINRQVDAGNGTRKACNTVGTSTAAGYPEHAFTWDVVVRTRALLVARDVDVRLTRPNDTGVGPCVDVRGRYGNALRADAVVSVHSDGAPASGSGFHLIEAARAPGGAGVAAAGHRLALAVRSALRAGSGLDHADYVAGGDGLDVRDDLAGLNLSARPTVLAEIGNMRHAPDATLLSSPAGRQRIAAALATGILTYLAG